MSRLNFTACFFTLRACALNLSTWWEARHWHQSGRRRRTSAHQSSGSSHPAVPHASTHQLSSSSRQAVSDPQDHRSYSPERGRRQQRHRQHHQHSRSRSINGNFSHRAPSPTQFASPTTQWNPSQWQQAQAERLREEAAAPSAELRARLPTWQVLPKSGPESWRPTTLPHKTALLPTTPSGLLVAAPKYRPAGPLKQTVSSQPVPCPPGVAAPKYHPAGPLKETVSSQPVPCPPGEEPSDQKIALYAFGARQEPEWLKK